MLFNIAEDSRVFMALIKKALHGSLSPDEQSRFDQLLNQHPEMKRQYNELLAEVKEAKLDELWERGFRVLLRCPQPEDRAYLESIKKSDPEAWRTFLKMAFVLRVMAESINNPTQPKFSNELSPDEEKNLLAAVKAAQERRKGHGSSSPAE